MKVTLKKARKLSKKLESWINKFLFTGSFPSAYLRISKYDIEDTNGIADGVCRIIKDKESSNFMLIYGIQMALDYHYTLRDLIRAKNVELEIDTLLTKKAALEKEIKILSDIVSNFVSISDEEEKVIIRKVVDTQQSTTMTSVEVGNVLGHKELNSIKSTLKSKKNELGDIEDELERRNASTITLKEDIISFLNSIDVL